MILHAKAAALAAALGSAAIVALSQSPAEGTGEMLQHSALAGVFAFAATYGAMRSRVARLEVDGTRFDRKLDELDAKLNRKHDQVIATILRTSERRAKPRA